MTVSVGDECKVELGECLQRTRAGGILIIYHGGFVMKNSILWLPLFIVIATLLLAASPAAAQESKTPTVTTAVLKGTVVQVEGNDLLVRMSTGELRNFNVPATRKFVIDGKELSVHQLQPGTTLTATVTTVTGPGTIQTKSVQSARVWFVSPPTVILTMPSGENKQFTVKDTVRIMVNGKPGTVRDLRKGDVISVQKVVEEPSVEIATNTTVVGHAPPVTAQSTQPAQTPTAAQSTQPAQTPTAAEVPPPAPVETKPVTPAPAETTSPLLWVVLIIALIVVVVVAVRMSRKKK